MVLSRSFNYKLSIIRSLLKTWFIIPSPYFPWLTKSDPGVPLRSNPISTGVIFNLVKMIFLSFTYDLTSLGCLLTMLDGNRTHMTTFVFNHPITVTYGPFHKVYVCVPKDSVRLFLCINKKLFTQVWFKWHNIWTPKKRLVYITSGRVYRYIWKTQNTLRQHTQQC